MRRSIGRFSMLVIIAMLGALAPVQAQDSTARATLPGRYPYTAADIAFVNGMIGHHTQAIVMAGWAPTHGASESVRILCARIINAQTDEISIMQAWLRARHQPVPDAGAMLSRMSMAGMPGMAGMAMAHDSVMPGMLTDAQMAKLDSARGSAFDHLFLTSMIQHHRGAISMVEKLMASPGAAQDDGIFKMANDIQADQGTEINRMTRMLLTMPGE